MAKGKNWGKILVVDDEPRMCQSLNDLLYSKGYEVETCQDAEDALQKIKNNDFDLIVADIKMPKFDGMEILKTAKNKDKECIVILITAYGSLESAIAAIKKGAYDYLLKPIDFTVLEFAIKRGLDQRKADLEKLKLLEELKNTNEQMKKKVAELDALHQAGKSMSSIMSLDKLLSQIVSLATKVIGAKTSSLMLLDEKGEFLTIKAALGLEQKIIKETRLPLGKSIAGWVAEKKNPLIVENIETDPRFKRISKAKYETKSLLSVPLKVKEKILGVINLNDKLTGENFTKEDLQLLTTFASQAAIAIDDANHFEEKSKKIAELSVLYEIASSLSKLDNFEEISQCIFDNLKKIIPLDFCLWLNWNEHEKKLVFATFKGNLIKNPKKLTETSFNLEQADILDSNKLSTKIFSQLKEMDAFSLSINFFTSVPIIAEGIFHGILSLGGEKGDGLAQDQKSLISIIASQAASIYDQQKAVLNATRLVTMGNMISEITHDLKKPLTNVKGNLQILREKWDNSSLQSELWDSTEKEIYRMTELVNEVVNFANPHRYQVERKSILSVLEKGLNLISRDLASQKINLKREFEENLPLIYLNENDILEAFLNLISNALESMGTGGELKVGAKRNFDSRKNQEFLQVFIQDQGYGISKENLSRIFQRYFTTKNSGTGLGLAIVERIVGAHNGFVEVKSEVGKGTTFFLNFPLER